MPPFKKILLIIESNEGQRNALVRGLALAERCGASLTVAGFAPVVPPGMQRLLPLARGDFQAQLTGEKSTELAQLLTALPQHAVPVDTTVLHGTPFLEIIREVLRNGHDLVVLTAEGRSASRWFGSTATHLMRKCPCPVWVTRPVPRERYTRVLAAVDVDPEGDAEGPLLNDVILETALALARLDGSALDVVHVWTVPGEYLLGRHGACNRETIDRLQQATRNKRASLLQSLLWRFDQQGIDHDLLLVHGEPAEKIPQVAAETGADLIVMGTVSRAGVAGLLIGNTAETVLDQVNCAVLCVKPPGFRSPIDPE
jgi:universal stress protein E